MKAFPNVQRKLNRAELRLLSDDEENDTKGRPTLLHVSRYSHLNKKATGTACKKKNFEGQMWPFLTWMWENGPVCKACKVAIEKFGDFYG